MRVLKNKEIKKMDCECCCDYRGRTVRTKGYAFKLHVCKYYEGCPYSVQNVDSLGVKKE